jgi:2-dehydro-3-deoxyphosphogluconate aldolase/(4S)-4-hydroxy-2-oxoglutarate aldolase
MKRKEVQEKIQEVGIVPGARVSSAELALFAAESVNEAGIPVAEITMTVPGAIKVIARLAAAHAEFIVGAGTVLDVETARRCVDAGARFLTSPGFIPEVVEYGLASDVVVSPAR